MNVYDKAHELAKAVKQSQEFREFRRAAEKLEKDKKAKEMLEDFRKKQWELQSEKLAGKDVKEKELQLQKLYEVLSYNQDIVNYLQAEARFYTLMSDISNIIGRAVDNSFPVSLNLLP